MKVLTGDLGKQWHEPKSAFRPKAGNTTYEKRQEERKAMAAVKAKENEMKEEKEAERKVRDIREYLASWHLNNLILTIGTEKSTSHQGQACCKGGEGQIREVGGDYAQKAS